MPRAPIKRLPPCKVLCALFDYDPVSGALKWRRKTGTAPRDYAFNNKCGGKRAGTITSSGYRMVGIRLADYAAEPTYFYAHRIIWKMMTGTDPLDQVDHRDRKRANNRWRNLRPADNGSNRWNSKRAKNNTSGVKGVCWVGTHNAWAAYIGSGRKQRRLGRFKSFEAACAARRAAENELHGEYARAA